ncbi:zinc finger-containing ubiquitin peptidase 1 isoform X2 [Moschus berezovskii]|uniref:zinc finger-containing ubiquitin peptidase 1 isoform X2 n=1 Tax=Moschus berezovskii TaxID=68408 RepID=UPI0024438BAF|nr:zinc finger-containing ubiquitin peptidase 1 isoform X2 [Moschus berezovskii]
MLSCDICGETVSSEPDMKAHLLIVHMENEVMCPLCKLSGVNYDEMCFHIEAAHFEQNELERNFKRINTVQYGTSENRKDSSLQCRADINSSVHSACASNQPKISAESLPKDGTLKHKDFYSENFTESRKFLKSTEKQSDRTKIKESIYETMYSPPECPFCGKIEDNSQDMETHVKTKHADLLDTPLEDCNQLLYDCPMCGLICTNYHILQEHVDLHLEESSFGQGVNRVQCSRDLELAQQLQQEEDRKRRSEESRQEMEEFQKLQRQYGLDNSGGYKQQQLRNMEIEVNRGRMHPSEFHRRKADMMESLAIGIDDGKTKTSGMSVPCIPKIQSMIEDAWKEGFDPQGASQLNNRLQGTKAWIGACEIYTLLTSLRIKCRIVDFHKSTGPLGTHPRLFEWILSYYASEREGSPKVVCTSKPPIYLQHQGHSRTVVGIEERKNRTLCLLVFDPGCPSREMQKLLKQDMEVSSLKQLRKFVGNLKHKQYQIVAVEGVLSSEEKIARRQASQVFTAEKIP